MQTPNQARILPRTAIVILNWNGREFLRKFLPSVLLHSAGSAEIIVADNASTDSSVEMLQQDFPSVKIISNLTNGGFAKGYNDALAQVVADYYVLLNSDIEVSEGWLQPLIDLMEQNPDAAACQPKLRAYHQPESFEYAGAAGGFIDHYGYPFCRGRVFQEIETDHGQYDDVCEIFWATGACMVVRADLFHRYGGLDADFFAHMEEIDFCWRMKNQGYRILYCPDSTVYHVGGGTLPKKSSQKTYLNFRNNLSLLYKNLPKGKLLPVFAVRFPLDGVAAIKFLFDGGFADFWAVARAHFHFYKHIKVLRNKRKALLQKPVSNVYQGNLVKEHFFGHIRKFSEMDGNKFSR